MAESDRFKNESQDARRHDEQHTVHPFEKQNKKKVGTHEGKGKLKKSR